MRDASPRDSRHACETRLRKLILLVTRRTLLLKAQNMHSEISRSLLDLKVVLDLLTGLKAKVCRNTSVVHAFQEH
jgi:hypothetical protein